jgi:diaminopimelate epimerase
VLVSPLPGGHEAAFSAGVAACSGYAMLIAMSTARQRLATWPATGSAEVLTFRKVHGAGNDFILVADPDQDRDWPEEARRLCARGTGIGADGLVVTTRRGPAAFEVWCFNADGSAATMCGNALRCAAFCAGRDHGDQTMSLVMAGAEHRAQVSGGDAAVTARAGAVLPRQVQVTWDGTGFAFDAVHTGTEHVVAIVDDVDDVDVPGCGRMVRHLPALAPLGSNVNFV